MIKPLIPSVFFERSPMKKLIFIFPIFLFLIAAAPTLLTGKIVGVSDGDTVILLTAEKKQVKIRLSGVDCPEKNQAYGQKAKEFTYDMVIQMDVTVKTYGTDRYGRTLGDIILPSGNSLSNALVRNGLAWHYKKYNSDQELSDLETAARNSRVGLWADPSPIPPWEFRKNPKTVSKAKSEYQSQGSKRHPSANTERFASPFAVEQDEMPAKETGNIVIFNINTMKVHCPNCSAASRCTNCVPITASDARSRGGVPCKICGGCGY